MAPGKIKWKSLTKTRLVSEYARTGEAVYGLQAISCCERFPVADAATALLRVGGVACDVTVAFQRHEFDGVPVSVSQIPRRGSTKGGRNRKGAVLIIRMVQRD